MADNKRHYVKARAWGDQRRTVDDCIKDSAWVRAWVGICADSESRNRINIQDKIWERKEVILNGR